ncbi:hypothetical protein IH982_01675 [Patescibacteria group bacterium]|nr:hypothetical protein [Patescibacteria group bacterium]
MSLKAYELFTQGEDSDAVILAETPEEAVSLLKAELREQRDDNTWVIVLPMSLFSPPRIDSEEEYMSDGMWHYRIQAAGSKQVLLLLNLEAEVELVMLIRELPLVRKI